MLPKNCNDCTDGSESDDWQERLNNGEKAEKGKNRCVESSSVIYRITPAVKMRPKVVIITSGGTKYDFDNVLLGFCVLR